MLKPLRKLHFSPSDSTDRRAALLNGLQDNLQILWSSLNLILDGNVVNTFTAGAGMIDSGSATNPIADIVAANATIKVNPDSIEVGTITGANIDDDSLLYDAELADAVRPVRMEMEKLRLILVQLVRLELGDQPERGWEGLNG